MTLALLEITGTRSGSICCKNNLTAVQAFTISSLAFDTLAAIALLAVGILSLTGGMALSPGACYACLGLGGAILLLDSGLFIHNCLKKKK